MSKTNPMTGLPNTEFVDLKVEDWFKCWAPEVINGRLAMVRARRARVQLRPPRKVQPPHSVSETFNTATCVWEAVGRPAGVASTKWFVWFVSCVSQNGSPPRITQLGYAFGASCEVTDHETYFQQFGSHGFAFLFWTAAVTWASIMPFQFNPQGEYIADPSSLEGKEGLSGFLAMDELNLKPAVELVHGRMVGAVS